MKMVSKFTLAFALAASVTGMAGCDMGYEKISTEGGSSMTDVRVYKEAQIVRQGITPTYSVSADFGEEQFCKITSYGSQLAITANTITSCKDFSAVKDPASHNKIEELRQYLDRAAPSATPGR